MSNTPEAKQDGCAFITGGGSGIGAAAARRLAAGGRPVALAGRSPEALEKVAEEIRGAGGRAMGLPCDVRDLPSIQDAVEQATGEHGAITTLVASAGVMPIGPMHSADPADWKRMIDVNILGVLHAIHAVLPGMRTSGRGHILVIGSVAGRHLFPDATVYCATKTALHVISEGLRSELARAARDDGNRIRVSLVAPGAVDTALPSTIADQESRAATEAWYAGMEGILQADDVAEAILWAIDAPDHVSVNEVMVRPTSMVR